MEEGRENAFLPIRGYKIRLTFTKMFSLNGVFKNESTFRRQKISDKPLESSEISGRMGRAGCSGPVFLWGAESAGAELPTVDGASAAFTALTLTLSPRETCRLSMPLSYCLLKVEKCVSGFKSYKSGKMKDYLRLMVLRKITGAGPGPLPHASLTHIFLLASAGWCVWGPGCVSGVCCHRSSMYEMGQGTSEPTVDVCALRTRGPRIWKSLTLVSVSFPGLLL